MSEGILLLCCGSFFKGGDNHENYEILEVDRNASQDAIKKAYKKKSLEIHPDKLTQRGIEVTVEHKQQFLKVTLISYEYA